MPVSSVIFCGIGFSGSTNVLKRSVISPPWMRTAPISVMRSDFGERPVVSRSKQMKSASSRASVSPVTAGTSSLTK